MNNQTDIALKNGKAISGAPIFNGIKKLPKTPTKNGMTTRNTMTVACIVTRLRRSKIQLRLDILATSFLDAIGFAAAQTPEPNKAS
jgi:hypothetical protein